MPLGYQQFVQTLYKYRYMKNYISQLVYDFLLSNLLFEIDLNLIFKIGFTLQ